MFSLLVVPHLIPPPGFFLGSCPFQGFAPCERLAEDRFGLGWQKQTNKHRAIAQRGPHQGAPIQTSECLLNQLPLCKDVAGEHRLQKAPLALHAVDDLTLPVSLHVNAFGLRVLALKVPPLLHLPDLVSLTSDQAAVGQSRRRARRAVEGARGRDVRVVQDVLRPRVLAGAPPQHQDRLRNRVVPRPEVKTLEPLLIWLGGCEHGVRRLPRQAPIQLQPPEVQTPTGPLAQCLAAQLVHGAEAAPAALTVQRDDTVVHRACLSVGLLKPRDVRRERVEEASL
mmetsp:Transcript_128975/g.413091  ORF Transcript_128975/g.413091 Transcript_128975/m.413091 type:complete len:282 (-) Transcript_128975:2929-3774(-)